ALMHYSKTKLGWKEAGTGTQVHEDRRIQMVLARPMEFGQMLHALGQKEVLDFRKDRSKPLELPRWAKEGEAEAQRLAVERPALPAPSGEGNAVDAEFTEVPKPALEPALKATEPAPA